MFEAHPGFRKRYPRGGFCSGYEHYESTGLTNLEESSVSLRDQQQHHNVTVIDNRQQHLAAEWDTATPEGFAEETKAERVYKGGALISFSFFQ